VRREPTTAGATHGKQARGGPVTVQRRTAASAERLRDHVGDEEREHADVDAGDEQVPSDRRDRLGVVGPFDSDSSAMRFDCGDGKATPVTNVAA
jgi:hypothetical protein